MRNATKYILLLLLLALPAVLSAQNRAALEKQREKLLKDIELTQELLKKTSSSREKSIDQLKTLEKQIEIRENIISNMSRDVAIVDAQVKETESIVRALERDLTDLKEKYANMLQQAYKTRSAVSQMVFIFSADNFNEAFSRAKYLQQYSEFRRRQAKLIEDTKEDLNARLEELEAKRNEKKRLLDDQLAQQNQLSKEQEEKSELVASLKTKEGQLKKDIAQKKGEAEKLNARIEDIIRKEIEEARRRAEAEAKASGKVGTFALTPEAAKLAADFTNNQGKLPWPVERGIISGRFGEQPHPVLPYIKINNKGIDIKTNENATARAVYDGTVVDVIVNPGFQKAVMISHGDYFTVYLKLRDVVVKPGDQVKVKQKIGVVYTDEKEGKTEMQLQIWKGTKNLNPALWLYAQ